MNVMRADLDLKKKQSIWETPRNIAILVTTVAVIAGLVGWKLGQREVGYRIVFQPGTVLVTSPDCAMTK